MIRVAVNLMSASASPPPTRGASQWCQRFRPWYALGNGLAFAVWSLRWSMRGPGRRRPRLLRGFHCIPLIPLYAIVCHPSADLLCRGRGSHSLHHHVRLDSQSCTTTVCRDCCGSGAIMAPGTHEQLFSGRSCAAPCLLRCFVRFAANPGPCCSCFDGGFGGGGGELRTAQDERRYTWARAKISFARTGLHPRHVVSGRAWRRINIESAAAPDPWWPRWRLQQATEESQNHRTYIPHTF